jgi:hypothetical protein
MGRDADRGTALSAPRSAAPARKEIMTDPNHRRGNAPWIVAVVLALVAGALVVFLVHTYSARNSDKRNAGRLLAPTAEQQKAVETGAIEAANLTTLSRANYEADFARALAGASGQLRQDLQAHKAAYLSAMNAGKFDLKASVVESAFESEAAGKVLILVTLNGTHVVDNVANPVATPQRLELTMVPSNGKWLAADFTAVNIQ